MRLGPHRAGDGRSPAVAAAFGQLPIQSPVPYTGERPEGPVVLQVYPGAEGEASRVDDPGDGRTEVRVAAGGDARSIEIDLAP